MDVSFGDLKAVIVLGCRFVFSLSFKGLITDTDPGFIIGCIDPVFTTYVSGSPFMGKSGEKAIRNTTAMAKNISHSSIFIVLFIVFLSTYLIAEGQFPQPVRAQGLVCLSSH